MATAPAITYEILAAGINVPKSVPQGEVLKEGFVLPVQVSVDPFFLGQPAQFKFIEGSQLPDVMPQKMLCGALNAPRLRLLQPIPLDVSLEEGHVVVGWDTVDEYGAGETLGSALDDFTASVRELYYHLASTDTLGPDLAKVKIHLAQYIAPR